jgi:hypothetical protein
MRAGDAMPKKLTLAQRRLAVREARHMQQHTTRQEHASKFNGAWRKSVESIFEAASYLIEAKRALEADEFEAMLDEDLLVSGGTARRIICIGQNQVLCSHVNKLPPHWGTLYELSQLTDQRLRAAIEADDINPSMERKDAVALKPQRRSRRPSNRQVDSPGCDSDPYDPNDVAEPGDDPAIINGRILINRLTEIGHQARVAVGNARDGMTTGDAELNAEIASRLADARQATGELYRHTEHARAEDDTVEETPEEQDFPSERFLIRAEAVLTELRDKMPSIARWKTGRSNKVRVDFIEVARAATELWGTVLRRLEGSED